MYTFVGLTPNTSYRVGATWVASTSRSTAAPLTVSGVLGGDVGFQINQQVAPSGYTQGGSQFNVIGVFRTTGTTLTVSWGSASSGTVAADAIHLVLADPGQEIQVVSDPGLDLADGGTLNLGATTLNSTLTKTFTISNQGTSNLVLAQSITLPPDYTITARTPATLFDGTNSTTIAPDGSPVSFTISVDTSTLGTKSGTISFGTNDPSENPFDFTISAIVNPTTVIIDNNGPYSPAPFSGVYSDTGNLSYFTNQGFLSDLREIASGATTRSATYTFNGLVDGGAYTVATTWTPFSNRSTAAPYAINQGSSTTTVTVNQQVAPNDFSDQGASWESLGVFRLSGTTTLVVTINGAASGNVIADAVRIERLFGPEIGVTYGSGTSVAVGDTVDMGSVGQGGTALSRTFTITNQGAENLTISGTLTPPTGFSLSGLSPGGLFGGGTTTLIPGATASFTVELSSTTQGSYSWPISFTTNDSDENPFAFTLTGTVTAPTATKQIIDNNGPTAPSPLAGTYTDSGNLGYWTGQGYLNDVREATTTNFATKSATYTFSGLTSGSTYSVAATWSAFSNRATNAPYTVSGVSGGPLTVLINQRIAPNDFSDEGGMWENLGAYVTSGTTLTVVLGGASTGSVIADAVRLEELIGPEIVVTSNSTNIAVGDTVALGQTLIGNPLRRTFTIQNVGVTAMDIGSSLTLPTGFTLVPAGDPTNPPNPTDLFSSPVVLGLGASAQFTLAVTTTSVASYSGIVSFTNSDANESPYSFTVTASVAGSAILDNGDAGTTNTGYTYYTSIGYNNDVHFAYNPSASIVSTWTFSGLAAGLYRVGATWVAHPNRATNASFTVSSSVGGGTATTAVNQRIAPVGVSSGGFAFQDLAGSFNHTGGNLVVTLTTLGANGYVIADAIRVAAPGTLLIDDKQARAAASANFVAGADSLAGISTPSSTLLTRDDVIPYLDQAVNYWKKIDPQAASKLSQVEVIIDDLPGAVLGLGEFDYPTIWLDKDAAGYGWRLDRTGVSTEREQGRVDLLSVMVHELGHVLNLPDLDPVLHPTSVMAGVLPVGISRVERGSWNSLDSLSDSGVLPSRLVDDPLGRLSVAWSNSREGDRFSGELTGRLEDGLFSELAEDFQPGVSPFSEAVDSGEALAYDETRSRRRLQLTVDKTREEEERLVDEALSEWELSESDPQV